jgi:hypothetical protein
MLQDLESLINNPREGCFVWNIDAAEETFKVFDRSDV